MKRLITIAAAVSLAALGGCGGGSSGPDRTRVAWPAAATAVDRTPEPFVGRRRASSALSDGRAITADQLFNWAQNNFPQYFPPHATTQQQGPWSYRAYPASGVMIGMKADEVFVVGGPFGSEPLRVGRAGDFIGAALPVGPTSYGNYKDTGLAPGPLPLTAGRHYTTRAASARAFADFEQAGRYSMVSMPADYTDADPERRGRVYVHRLHDDGSSIDITSQLVDGDPTGCVHPRKAVVADFNDDGVPDVFFACHGSEAATAPASARTELPVLMLSQPGGRYRVAPVPLSAPVYAHGAAAADIDGDGRVDIVLADISQNERGRSPVWALLNAGGGRFVEDHAGIPSTITTGIWSVEFVSVGGRTLLWVAGNDRSTVSNGHTQALYAFAGGRIDPRPVLTLPEMPDHAVPLDITVQGDVAYVLRVSPAYSDYAVQRVDLNRLQGSALFVYQGPDFGSLFATVAACAGLGGRWVDWLRVQGGRLVSDDSCRSPALPLPG